MIYDSPLTSSTAWNFLIYSMEWWMRQIECIPWGILNALVQIRLMNWNICKIWRLQLRSLVATALDFSGHKLIGNALHACSLLQCFSYICRTTCWLTLYQRHRSSCNVLCCHPSSMDVQYPVPQLVKWCSWRSTAGLSSLELMTTINATPSYACAWGVLHLCPLLICPLLICPLHMCVTGMRHRYCMEEHLNGWSRL